MVQTLIQRGSFLSISTDSVRRWRKNQLEGVKTRKTRLYISLHSRDSSVAVALPCWTFICVGSCYIRRACGNTGIRGRGIALYRSYVSPTHRYPPSRWPYSFRGKQSIRKRSAILRRSAVPRMLMRQQHREVALETPFFFFSSLSSAYVRVKTRNWFTDRLPRSLPPRRYFIDRRTAFAFTLRDPKINRLPSNIRTCPVDQPGRDVIGR